jgi:hypothetical protein
MVDILLMRGRRLKIFCSVYVMTLMVWNGTGFGGVGKKISRMGE